MGMKELIQEQLSEYQLKYNELEKDCIQAMNENKPYSEYEEKVMKAAGLKLMIDHCKYEIDNLFKQEEKKGIKVVFGLEEQGHIPTIQAELKRWNDSYKEQFPNSEPLDMSYSTHVWEGIGKIIGWSPFNAALSYFEWLNNDHR